jgi:hypothetical protein
MIYFACKQDRHACALKPQCCPNVPARKIARSVHEAARDKARAIAKTEAYAVSCRERKKVEMLFAHLKRILRLGRLRISDVSSGAAIIEMLNDAFETLTAALRPRGVTCSNLSAMRCWRRSRSMSWTKRQPAAALSMLLLRRRPT